ncbi:MAG TPA: ABC transporter permease [Dehalococcoidia bacterium]|nr:ABC transporter permease [Dehalococcoidia bacterium]
MTLTGVRTALKVFLTPAAVAVGLLLIYVYLANTRAQLGDDQILSRAFLLDRLIQHIQLVVVAFAFAVAIALPLGITMAGSGRFWQGPVFALASLGQIVPSIAALALAFTFVGLGFRPTVIALVLYALLPILRNTVAGLHAVDSSVVEAARGMGMTDVQTLVRVRLPLAAPAIFAGLRTSLVLVIGTATLGNFIGGGGLGDVIAAGIGAGRDRIVLAGAGMVAALALLADWGFGLLEQALTPKT